MNWIKLYSIITIFCFAAAFIVLLIYGNFDLSAIWGFVSAGFGFVGLVAGIVLINMKRIKNKNMVY